MKSGDIYVEISEPDKSKNGQRMCQILIEPYPNDHPDNWRVNIGFFKDSQINIMQQPGIIVFNPNNQHFIEIGNLSDYSKKPGPPILFSSIVWI